MQNLLAEEIVKVQNQQQPSNNTCTTTIPYLSPTGAIISSNNSLDNQHSSGDIEVSNYTFLI